MSLDRRLQRLEHRAIAAFPAPTPAEWRDYRGVHMVISHHLRHHDDIAERLRVAVAAGAVDPVVDDAIASFLRCIAQKRVCEMCQRDIIGLWLAETEQHVRGDRPNLIES